MIAIRPAAEHETALILGFIRDLAIYERLEHAVVATEANLRRTLFGPHPVAHALFACIDDRPGVYLEDLYVRPAARGRGVGRAVLAYLARLALEQGCGRLEWSVLDWNEPAIRFYRALEAVAADDWTTFRLSGEALARLATHSHSRPPPA
jgi:GNAT superfamily N-acetyltransferase